MSYPDQFELSRQKYPNSGYHLSKSECGFILPELEEVVRRYKNALADPTMSDHLSQMTQHHLDGLEYILKAVRKGAGRACKVL